MLTLSLLFHAELDTPNSDRVTLVVAHIVALREADNDCTVITMATGENYRVRVPYGECLRRLIIQPHVASSPQSPIRYGFQGS